MKSDCAMIAKTKFANLKEFFFMDEGTFFYLLYFFFQMDYFKLYYGFSM